MVVRQIHTRKTYEMTQEKWDSLGLRQKLFQVVEQESKPQAISNKLPGKATAGKQDTETKTNKNK